MKKVKTKRRTFQARTWLFERWGLTRPKEKLVRTKKVLCPSKNCTLNVTHSLKFKWLRIFLDTKNSIPSPTSHTTGKQTVTPECYRLHNTHPASEIGREMMNRKTHPATKISSSYFGIRREDERRGEDTRTPPAPPDDSERIPHSPLSRQ